MIRFIWRGSGSARWKTNANGRDIEPYGCAAPVPILVVAELDPAIHEAVPFTQRKRHRRMDARIKSTPPRGNASKRPGMTKRSCTPKRQSRSPGYKSQWNQVSAGPRPNRTRSFASRRMLTQMRADHSAYRQSAMIMSNSVLAPLMPHSMKATAPSTKAMIPADHSSQ